MRPESIELLRRFYNSCKDQVELQKGLKSDSLLLSCLDGKSNTRYRILNDAAISIVKVNTAALDELLGAGWVREAGEASRYSITALGLWEVERNDRLLDEIGLLEYLDSKYFDLFGGTPKLKDRERVILLALIAARAFSDKSCVDLLKDSHTMDGWRTIIEKSYQLLFSLGFVAKLDETALFAAKGNEHPVSHLIRHTDALPRKTKGLYKAPGKQKYFLDLYDGSGVPVPKLSYLLRIVFEGKLGIDAIDSVLALCREIAYGDSIHVFDLDQHLFSKPAYDDLIRDALLKSIMWRE